ncbi:MAG TPA: CotH kinase family protein, partial [Saprospiraceae bacterium]|nr:CotH kinase family protein [Saprospiraceae bacterium]
IHYPKFNELLVQNTKFLLTLFPDAQLLSAMRHFPLLLLCICAAALLRAQSANTLYDDSRVSEVRIWLPHDSLQYMINELVNARYLHADFVFYDGSRRDTVQDIGLRLRGNTSLGAKKKSFKVSFNAFAAGRKYQGVKKLNLLGSHNDPTMVRQKLFYDVWARAGMPPRRASFVKLYINDTYRGLYTNMEEIDKEWLERSYGDDEGNLYKCTWPANLGYMGPDQSAYKSLLNNPDTRAYDLSTNETADDYSRLVALITALHAPVDAAFPGKISAILNVEGVLKAYAIDVATGNWDDYFYNKNNYYLYDNPQSGRFEFVTYDADNTFGVDWLGQDWAKRNSLAWQISTDPRPLATQLLAVPVYKQRFVHLLDSVSRFVTCPDALWPRVQALHELIAPAALVDLFRTLDYGYTADDFHQGFEVAVDGHTPYGIRSFLSTRCQYTSQQIAPFVSVPRPAEPDLGLRISPNPASGYWQVQVGAAWQGAALRLTLVDMEGRPVKQASWQVAAAAHPLSADGLPAGLYGARVELPAFGLAATTLLMLLK